jgi:hypothetical protein
MIKRPVVKYLILALIIVLLLVVGYYRDFIFKGINAIMQAAYLGVPYTAPPSLAFLLTYTPAELSTLKWWLTLLFTVVYFAIALFTIHILFHNKRFNQFTIGAYVVVLLLSALFTATGRLLPGVSDKTYEFSRYLMGMAQSPIILMILIPTFKLSLKQDSNIPN